jgi:hypothetical protein
VEVLPALLNDAGDRPLDNAWFNGGRLAGRELAALETYHSHPRQLLLQWCKARCLPCRTSLMATGGIRPAHLDTDRYGWHRHPLTRVSDGERRRLSTCARCQYREAVQTLHPADPSVRALHALLRLCRLDGVPVALVLMPEGSTFRELYPMDVRQGLDAVVAAAAAEHDVPVVDARCWVADDGFWDGHHLVADGAAAYSDRLWREAIRPLTWSVCAAGGGSTR